MGLLDTITGKTEKVAAKPAAKKPAKKADVLDMVKDEPKKSDAATVAQLKDNTGHAHRVLMSHHLSEKTNMMSTKGTYVFKVATSTNKIEVKKAVEAVYDVHVVNVNMLNTKSKFRRYGRTSGKTSAWKKAIVTLKDGEKIAGLAEGV